MKSENKNIVSLTANVPKKFAEAVKDLHKKYNCELDQYSDYKNEWITVTVRGVMEDLEWLNRECELKAYSIAYNIFKFDDYIKNKHLTK